jgi:hypothetical protein
MRVARSLLSFLFFLATVALIAGVLAIYLAASGRSLPLLGSLAGGMSRVMEGQRTEQLDLRVRLRPAARELSGTAHLEVHAEAAGRRHLYFLLNDGLRIERVWEERPDGTESSLSHHRFWLMSVIALPRALAEGESVRIGVRYRGDPTRGSWSISSSFMSPSEVVIGVDSLWYPNDLHSFFRATVEVTAPRSLSVVNNARDIVRERYGESERVRWSPSRPVPGLALVAGRFRVWSGQRATTRYRVLLPEDVDLDGDRILSDLAASDQTLSALYGASGFPELTLFVSRGLARGFHDGSGVIGVPPHAFHGGDYGLVVIAHEVAHGWWGATVAAEWLRPDTGGQWLVEGLAGFSSWLAARERLGDAAFRRLVERSFFDPTAPGTLASKTVLDNTLDPAARAIIYDKGAFVAHLLHGLLGEPMFFASTQEFLRRFQFKTATVDDFAKVAREVSEQDLKAFFDVWLRSDMQQDLSLDPQDGGAAVHNSGMAPAPDSVDLWRFVAGEEPARQTIPRDGNTPLGNVERLVLDPLARTADMYRHNNVFPRRQNPRAVLRSARGDLAVVYGEPEPWAPAVIEQRDAQGQAAHSWTFDRGLARDPVWSADGTRLLAIERDRGGPAKLLALNAADGSTGKLGGEVEATALPDGVAFAHGARLVRRSQGSEVILADHSGACIASPRAAPDAANVAYAVVTEREMDLWVARSDGGGTRLLFTAHPSEVSLHWSPDSAHVYAVLAGDWDWQVWELAVDGRAPRALVREAAAVTGLVVSPSGRQIAIVATATLGFGQERREVFVIDRQTGHAAPFNLSGRDAHSVAWLDDQSLVVVASDPTYEVVPQHRELRKLLLADGALVEFP